MPILQLAHAVEERGFTGLFLNEHTHIPVECPRSQYPPGGPIPERYARFWDPYTALSFVAAQTGLEVGPTVILLGVPPSSVNYQRIAQWADGWMPMGNALYDPDFPRQIAELKREWSDAGRDPKTLRLSVLLTGFVRKESDVTRPAVAMGPDQIADALDRAQAIGVERVMVAGLGHGPAEKILPRLDALAAAVSRVLR